MRQRSGRFIPYCCSMLAIAAIERNSSNWFQATSTITPMLTLCQPVPCWLGLLSWSTRRGSNFVEWLDIGNKQFGEKSTLSQFNIASAFIPGLHLIGRISNVVSLDMFQNNECLDNFLGSCIRAINESLGWTTQHYRQICAKHYMQRCWP